MKASIKQSSEYHYINLLISPPYNERLTIAVGKAKDRAVCHGFDLDKISMAADEIIKDRGIINDPSKKM